MRTHKEMGQDAVRSRPFAQAGQLSVRPDLQTRARAHAPFVVRDIATFFEQPLQYGGCISDFQNYCCNLISKKEVAAAIFKIANTTSNLGLCCTSVLGQLKL